MVIIFVTYKPFKNFNDVLVKFKKKFKKVHIS